jgi:hypothetical protein
MRSELSETARLLIRTATAQELKPGPEYRARLLEAVRARARAPDGALDEAAQMAPWTGASPLAPLTVWKVAAVAALGAGLGLGTVGIAQTVVDRPQHEHSTTHVATPRARAATGQNGPRLSSRLAPSPSAPRPVDDFTAPKQLTSAPAPQPALASSPLPEGTTARSSPGLPEVQTFDEFVSSAPNAAALRAELSLLKEVQGALRVGRARRALELIARHEREFPNGQLGNERLAAEVFAACQLGDVPRARSASLRFMERDTSSPLALRVKGACGLSAMPQPFPMTDPPASSTHLP